MFLILLNYKRPSSDVDALLGEHNAFLERHYASGSFVMSGRQVPRTGGVILARGVTRQELEAIVETDPFKVHDVADYHVIEFLPTRAAAEFASLA